MKIKTRNPSERRINKRSWKSTDKSNQTGVWTKKKELQGETYRIEIANLEVRRIRGDMIEVYTVNPRINAPAFIRAIDQNPGVY